MTKKIGDVLFTCEPYVHVLLQKERDARCEWCLLPQKRLRKCTACGLVKYCSVQCQRSDWSVHKVECACLQRVAPSIPLDSVRLFLRILIRHQRADNSRLWPNDPGWRTFDDLQSHREEISQDVLRSDQFSKIMYTIDQLVNDSFTLPPGDSLLDMFGQMSINTFTVCDGENQSIGSAIYISPSRLDHSCCPNSGVVFSGKTLTLRALTDIPDASPENLFISYIDQLDNREVRRKQLCDQYYFLCQCERCHDDELERQMMSTKCDQINCEGVVCLDADEACCRECGSIPGSYGKDKVSEIIEYSKAAIQKIDQAKKLKDFQDVLSQCEECLRRQSSILHGRNIYVVKCLDRAYDACVEIGKWEKALTYGLQTLAPYQKYYSPYNPNVGLLLTKIGKLELYQQRLRPALQHLHQAVRILEVTHGRDHDLYAEVRSLVDQCEEELRVGLEKSTAD